jgi:hypothetical protein
MKAGGLALENLIQPTISLELPVPSQSHYVFTVFRLLTDFVCLNQRRNQKLQIEEYNTMAKKNKRTKIIYKTLHRKLKIE